MEKEANANVYEVCYLLVPSISEENLGAEVIELKDSLTDLGSVIISDEYPKMMELAYEMSRSVANKKQKFTQGYLGWFKFTATSESIIVIKDMLDKNKKLIRFLLIKTIRENTISQKRSHGRSEFSRRRSTPKVEESVPLDEKTIDKEIEALVVE